MSKTNKWNNLNGLMMILVVLCEFLFAFKDTSKVYYILKIVYTFYISTLAFSSGYLYKKDGEESTLKLFVYYLITNTIIMWLSLILHNTNFNLLTSFYMLWFLIALIVWKFFAKHFGELKGLFLFSLIVSLSIGFFKELDNTIILTNIIAYFPFFILGYKLNDNKIREIIDKKKLLFKIIGFVLLLISLVGLVKIIPRFELNEIMMLSYITNKQIVNRLIIYLISVFTVLGMTITVPTQKLPFLSKWGCNYLYILIFSSIFTTIFLKFIPIVDKTIFYLIISTILTLFICLIFGNNKIKIWTEKLYQKCQKVFQNNTFSKSRIFLTAIIILITIITLLTPVIIDEIFEEETEVIYPKISQVEEKSIDDSVSILFTGDLILLKEQVKRGYDSDTGKYNFDSIFEYTKKYIDNADFSIGVFEGPMAGKEKGYSNSDIDDVEEIHLNYPDEFATAVKNAGFDLVTLANNHILDKGKDGAIRTSEVLDSIGLDYTGIIKKERNNSKIVEINGLKVGVLSYTYGIAYNNEDEAIKQNITPILVNRVNKNFSKVKKQVEEDFKKLKEKNPDTIIVLPHMGTQFTGEVDYFQKTWNDIFIENGASIILGDHSHHVQPVEYRKNKQGDDVLIVYSPGNFANSYIDYDGDATAMVEIYLDKNNANLIGSSIIPMWTYSSLEGNYQAVPIYDILNNSKLREELSVNDFKRVKEVYELTTSTMINKKIDLENSEEKLFFSKNGYKRKSVPALKISDNQKEKKLFQMINNANSVIFIGDSVTEGTMNGGYAWFEPLMNNFKNKKVINISKGSTTVKMITEKYNKEQADLYVIAIGTNDIRYRNKKNCAMDEDSYIKSLEKLINKIPNKDTAKFVFIAPWMSMDYDKVMSNEKLKISLMEKYTKSLKEFCNKNGYLFINPNKEIKDILNKEITSKYLVDYIHPNASNGIYLYSEAVLNASS